MPILIGNVNGEGADNVGITQQRMLFPWMVVASLLVHAVVAALCWTADIELPSAIPPQEGKASILVRVSAAARPKPLEDPFQKTLTDLPTLPEVTVPPPTPITLENVVRPRDTFPPVLADLKAVPVVPVPEDATLEPLTLPVAKTPKGTAFAGPVAHLEAALARPKSDTDVVPTLRPHKTIVPPVEQPPLTTPSETAKPATMHPRIQVSKDGPEALPRPISKEDLPKFEPVTKIAEVVAVASEASDASQGVTADELPQKSPINLAPPYPADALAAGYQGTVSLRVRIDAGGKVSAISVYSSSGTRSLDESALAAVRNWVFTPARRRGQAIPYEVLVPIEFFLRRRS
jgi:periplasmic protein TonB